MSQSKTEATDPLRLFSQNSHEITVFHSVSLCCLHFRCTRETNVRLTWINAPGRNCSLSARPAEILAMVTERGRKWTPRRSTSATRSLANKTSRLATDSRESGSTSSKRFVCGIRAESARRPRSAGILHRSAGAAIEIVSSPVTIFLIATRTLSVFSGFAANRYAQRNQVVPERGVRVQ